MNVCTSTEVNNSKYIEYQRTFSFLYAKNIDGVGSILFSMKDFKPKNEIILLHFLNSNDIRKSNQEAFEFFLNAKMNLKLDIVQQW